MKWLRLWLFMIFAICLIGAIGDIHRDLRDLIYEINQAAKAKP